MSHDSHHGHGHSHDLKSVGAEPIRGIAARVVIGLLIAIAIAVAAGAVLLWPNGTKVDVALPFQSAPGAAVLTESGSVVSQDMSACGSPSSGKVFGGDPLPSTAQGGQCIRSIVDITSGPNAGARTLLEYTPAPDTPPIKVGEDIRLVRQQDSTGQTVYGFYDYERTAPLLVFAALFAIVIVAVARWRGLRALVGIVVAFGVLVYFLLPSLLAGHSAVGVALVGGAAILFAVLYLAHGVNLRTSAALLGTLCALGLSAGLSAQAVTMTHVTGLSEEQNSNVQLYLGHVSISGLLLAGFIIGSLGVLNDVTVTQSAAVFEFAVLDPAASRRTVFTGAMRVGRDHIASTVYTLVLAYAGSALPLMLLFSVAGRSLTDVLTGDDVAIELVRSFVGGIALALSVPLTTAIATLLAVNRQAKVPSAGSGRHAK